jgi:bifunctional DNA-binding transcriptional regulator/antitoxin component of YhaV-PrlF toxin-antitoxin module
MGDTVRIKPRGNVRLLATIRERYGIEPGDAYHIVDLDGTFVLSPVAPKVPELAQEISELREEAGLSVADLITGLREQRERYVSEHGLIPEVEGKTSTDRRPHP